ncbi:MAG TPA: 6-pyruvoyl-tetrahydropterin synthase-related protein, partial [Dehalococcoidia bacterium]|nr:6-pyruvoyl-tetrahydropterin synthase-related protein [Dehalococcoidia bacterium]
MGSPSHRGVGVLQSQAGLILVLTAALIVGRPIFDPYFVNATDGLLHLYRALDFRSVLESGLPWPRIAPSLLYGYGYAVFDFYSPLVYYLASASQWLGATPVGAMEQILWASLALAGISYYVYARSFLGPLAAGVGGVVYLATPYHVYDLYHQSDYPQNLAFAFIPLVFLGLHRSFTKPGPATVVVLALTGALVILTHNLTAFLLAPFLTVYVLVGLARRLAAGGPRSMTPPAATLAMAGLLVALLTLGHWLPILADATHVQIDRLGGAQYAANFVDPARPFVLSVWPDFAAMIGGRSAEGFRLTLLQLAAAALGLIVPLVRGPRSTLASEVVTQAILGGLAVFLTTSASGLLWERVPILDLAQFPSRFLGLAALPAAFLAAAGIGALDRWGRIAAAVTLTAGAVLAAAQMPASQIVLDTGDLSPRGSLQLELSYGPDGGVAKDEFVPRAMGDPPWTSPWALAEVASWQPPAGSDLPLLRSQSEPTRRSYELTGWAGGRRTLDTAFYPGWRAVIDGQPAGIAAGPSGFIEVDVPADSDRLELIFEGTRLQRLAEI